MSNKIDFSWSYSDPLNPTAFFRLYEDSVMVVDNISELKFSLLMTGRADGNYVYYVTAVDPVSLGESLPSNSVTVNFTQAGNVPAAPTGLTFLLS